MAKAHWRDGAKQILAVGDVDGGVDVDGDGIPDTEGHPDLIVNDGQFLWLYYGDRSGYLDAVREPVLLASGGSMTTDGLTLDKVTLAAPGDFTGDGDIDLLARYDVAGSGLYLYDSLNPDSPDGHHLDAEHRTQLLSRYFGPESIAILTAAPDANNNGQFDLWTSTSTYNPGRLRFWADFTTAGYTDVTVASEAFGGYLSLG